MTTPTNPERIVAARQGEDPVYLDARTPRLDGTLRDEESAYVREDVAAEQTAAALRGEAHETTALRRERDALAAERDQLKAHVLGMADRETWLEGRIERLTEALHEVVVLADVAPHEKADAHAIVKVADDALAAQAGKGVG